MIEYFNDAFAKIDIAKEKYTEGKKQRPKLMSEIGMPFQEFVYLYQSGGEKDDLILERYRQKLLLFINMFSKVKIKAESGKRMLSKVLDKWVTIKESCREYGHIEGVVKSNKNIDAVDKENRYVDKLLKKYDRIYRRYNQEVNMLNKAKRLAASSNNVKEKEPTQ